MRRTARSNHFVLEAFDRDQWCPVLQARFQVHDLDALRATVGKAADDDPGLEQCYRLDNDDLAAIVAKFAIAFDPTQLQARELDISLFRWRRSFESPYLIHTGYELPLLLDGRKKLARMSHAYPPATFDGEDRFEHWVAKGFLHREEVVEPFHPPAKKYLGHRMVYYTPKGEEWRIPASKLIWEASGKCGGWNEHFERLEGMLYGYKDWQNDWWIKVGLQGGGFGGLHLCCAVTARGLAWMEAAGFRALPPVDKPSVAVAVYDVADQIELLAFMREDPDSAALVRFNLLGRDAMPLMDDFRNAGPWHIPRDRIPELNRSLRGAVVIVARRDGPL
ncbi:MAG TPA: hypothetical protein VIY51_24315 [Xanthobacteraceae bacterium]